MTPDRDVTAFWANCPALGNLRPGEAMATRASEQIGQTFRRLDAPCPNTYTPTPISQHG